MPKHILSMRAAAEQFPAEARVLRRAKRDAAKRWIDKRAAYDAYRAVIGTEGESEAWKAVRRTSELVDHAEQHVLNLRYEIDNLAYRARIERITPK